MPANMHIPVEGERINGPAAGLEVGMKYHIIKTILALVLLAGALPLSAQMIAEIIGPVETEFGTYIPQPSQILPAAESYSVAPDLSNVVNAGDFSFDAAERGLLARNHFFVTPKRSGDHSGYKEMYDLYNEAREQNIPIFVTTDALLHSFHLIFDHMLMEIEEAHFYGDLDRLLSGLLEIVQYQLYPAVNEDSTRAAIHQAMDYLIVAKCMLDSTFDPKINGGSYIPECSLIRSHSGPADSPIFHYEEDYTQYIVRGHYTRSDSLARYFRAMMWLGRMTFAADPDPLFAPLNHRATLSALLLLQAMERLTINGEPALTVWERIYAPTVFFVGKSDDTTPLAYLELIRQIYGDDFRSLDVNQLGAEPRFSSFLAAAMDLPGPLIEYPGQPKGFRLMGQRFIPDSYVLDQLVFNNIPDRFMPTGLDVMAVLGSGRAYSLLKEQGEMANAAYKQRLDELRTEFKAYPAETWAQNLYWNWLYSLMPLLWAKGAGYPPFMQNPAWVDKELYAALGSWAELRHDTILYAKQSGTEKSLHAANLLRQGYVEPNPHFFGRIAALARFLITGLEQRGLLTAKFALHLGDFEELALELKTIAEKELLERPLSSEEYQTILRFGLALQRLAEFSDQPGISGPSPFSEEVMPVIADVHSDFNSMTCLEEGVGYPFTLYVICRIEGELVVTRGAGYSWYEFVHPMSDRLTDEAWRAMLQKGTEPDPPAWSGSFLLGGWSNPNPGFYLSNKSGVNALVVRLAAESLAPGDGQSMIISTTGALFTAAPAVTLIDPRGGQRELGGAIPVEGGWQLAIPTAGLPSGRCYLAVEGTVKDFDGSAIPLSCRTGFIVTGGTAVECPQAAAAPAAPELLRSYPNPFNSSTLISYSLAAPAEVRLSVYDLQGREIAVLYRGREAAGSYSVRWQGTDGAGRPLPSSLYFAVLEAGGLRQVCKMVLME